MVRIPVVESKEGLPPDKRHVYDDIARGRSRVATSFKVMLHSPEMAGRIAALGDFFHLGRSLEPAVQEMVILATAREHDAQFAWTTHEPMARRAGVREEAIVAVRERKALEGLTAEEKVVVQYVLELLRTHRVSEPTFQAALARFGVSGLVELTGTVGYYTMHAAVLNAFEVEPDPGLTPLLPV